MPTRPTFTSDVRERLARGAHDDDAARDLLALHMSRYSPGGAEASAQASAIKAAEGPIILSGYEGALSTLEGIAGGRLRTFSFLAHPRLADRVRLPTPFVKPGGAQVRLLGLLTNIEAQAVASPSLLDLGVSHLVTISLDPSSPAGWRREHLFPDAPGFPAVRVCTDAARLPYLVIDVLLDISLYHWFAALVPQSLHGQPSFSSAKVRFLLGTHGKSTYYGPVSSDAPYVSLAASVRSGPTLSYAELQECFVRWNNFVHDLPGGSPSVQRLPLTPAPPLSLQTRLSAEQKSPTARALVAPDLRRHLGRRLETKIHELPQGHYALLRIVRKPRTTAARTKLRYAIGGWRARLRVGAWRVVRLDHLVRYDHVREYIDVIRFERSPPA